MRARRQFEGKKVIVVFVKRRASLVLPDKDMDLGELGPDNNIQIFSQMTPQGRTWAPKKYRRKQIEPNELGKASKMKSANYQRDDLRGPRCTLNLRIFASGSPALIDSRPYLGGSRICCRTCNLKLEWCSPRAAWFSFIGQLEVSANLS